MKNKLFLLLAMASLALVIWLLKEERKSAAVSIKDFAVKDTGAVDRIFLADKAGHQILLERAGSGKWIGNKHFSARQDVIQNLLLTLRTIAVKMPVPIAAHNYVISQLASNGVKVELYVRGELLKTYYVGGPTQDLLGTYMLLENGDRAYVMHIPGFNGYLSTRYSPMEENWKERFLFKTNSDSLASIEINYPKSDLASFTLNLKTGTVKSGCITRSGVWSHADVQKYSKFFEHPAFEGWVTSFSTMQKDSLLHTKSLAVVRITAANGIVKTIRFFPVKEDPERMYANTLDSGLYLVQHFVMDSILLQFQAIPRLRENIYQQPK